MCDKYSPPYKFHLSNLEEGQEVLFQGVSYDAQNLFSTDDPCKMVDFIEAVGDQLGESYIQEFPNSIGIIECLKEQCFGTPGNDAGGGPHDPFIDEPSGNGSHDGPVTEENPETLGYDLPDIDGVVDSEYSYPEDQRNAAEQYYSQANYLEDYEIEDKARERGESEDQVRETLDRAAKGEPEESQPHNGRSKNEEQDFTLVAEPVNLFTGEYYFEKTDLEIPSRGFPFRLTRTYKSGRVFYSPLGFNFDHNYNIYLRKLDTGGVAINTGRLQEDIYTLDAEGTFTPPEGVFAELEETGGRFGTPDGYLLTYSGGEQHLFELPPSWLYPEKIPLVKISDANDNAQELAYNSDGLLDYVLDTIGRKIVFTYNSCKLLTSVKTAFTDLEVNFAYDSYIDHLTQAASPASENFPDGIITCYEYDNYQNHPALTHNIVRVTNALGEVQVENTYGIDPGAYDFNRVIHQYFNGSEYLFSYTQLRFVPPMAEYINDGYYQTTYCAPCEPEKVYTFNYRGNLLGERYRLSADGTYRLWAMTYQYNKYGQVTEVRKPSGLGLTYVYDEDNENVRARGNLLKVILRAPSVTMQPAREIMTLTYESLFQKIKSIQDEEGNVTEMIFDYEENPSGPAAGNIVKIIHPTCSLADGTEQEAVETFAYNAYGQLERFTSAEGRSVIYEYHESGDGKGLLRKVTYEDTDAPYVMEYTYDSRGNTASVADGNGNKTSFEYDRYGNLIKTLLPQIDGSFPVYEYIYDALHRLIEERSPKGDYSDSMLSDDYLNHTFLYDLTGNMVEQIKYANTASPQKTVLERDASGNITKVTGPSGQVISFEFDERGLLLEKVLFDGSSDPRITGYTYDVNGNLLAVTFPDGSKTHYDYDPWDKLKELKLPGYPEEERSRILYEYHERDLVSQITFEGVKNPGSAPEILRQEKLHYDEGGRLYKTENNGLAYTFIYDRDNLVLEVNNFKSNWQVMDYDGTGRLKMTEDPFRNIREFTYDPAGNLILLRDETVNPSDASVSEYLYEYGYDARDRMIKMTGPFGNVTRVEYDDRNLAVKSVNPLNDEVRLVYNLDGAPVKTEMTDSATGSTMTNSWEIDNLGNAQKFIDANLNETLYEFDAYNQLSKTIYPDGRELRKSYDVFGRLASETDPNGSTVTYHYSQAGTLEKVSFFPAPGVAPTPDITYNYDGLGRQVEVSQDGEVEIREYDFLDRIVTATSHARTIHNEYDDPGLKSRLIFPDGRTDTRYWDSLGRLSRVEFTSPGYAGLPGPEIPAGSMLASYGFEGTNPIQKKLLNEQTTRYFYNKANKLENISGTDEGGNSFWDERYLYDADYRKRLVIENVSPSFDGHKLYDYDSLARLTGIYRLDTMPPLPSLETQDAVDAFIDSIDKTAAGSSEMYILENTGGRQSWEINNTGDTTTYLPVTNNLHQIVELTLTDNSSSLTETFTYDFNGNRIEDARFTYQYDCLNQPVSITRKSDGQTVMELTYNGFGQLVETKDENGKITRFIYDGARLIQTEDGSTGEVEEQFTGGLAKEEIVLHSTAAGNYFYHQDDLFSLKAVSDESGNLLESYSYTAFGKPSILDQTGAAIPSEDALVMPRFGGRPYIHSLGLYYNKARWYDPELGMFLQRDPLGYVDSASLYEYARHNPVSYNDPTGYYIESAWDALSLGIGLTSFGYNWSQGNYGYMALDGLGILADTAALLLPIPGGAGVAIKALRIGSAITDVTTTSLKTKTVVRGLQAADQGVNALLGANIAYENYKEESYGWAAFNVAASALGVRGFFGKAADAIRPGKATEVFSRQGDLFNILDPSLNGTGRIWGVTMGRVYGTLKEKQSMFHTSKSFKNSPDDVMFKFTGQAAELFSSIPVKGPFTGLKAITGQQTTAMGDIVLKTSIAIGKVIGDNILVKWQKSGRAFIEVTEASLEKSMVPDSIFRQLKYGFVTPKTQHQFMTALDAGMSLGVAGSLVVLTAQTPLGNFINRIASDFDSRVESLLGKTSEGGC